MNLLTAEQKKKVILINPIAIDISGVDESLYYFLKTLDKERYEPLLVIPEKSYYSERYSGLGVRIFIVDMDCLKRESNPLFYIVYIFKLLISVLRFMRVFIKEKADIIHVNMFSTLSPGIAAKMLGVPVIYHFRASTALRPLRVFRLFYSLVCLLATEIITISKTSSEMLQESTGKRISVIYDSVEFEKETIIRKGSINDKPVNLGILTRIQRDKNLEIVLNALGILRERGVLATFTVAGSALGEKGKQYFEELKVIVKELSLEKSVVFRGTVRDIAAELDSFDIYVFPVSTEGFVPRSVIEALVRGVPLLAYDQQGVREINLKGDINLLDSLNPEKWAERISDMCKNELKGNRQLSEFYREAFGAMLCTKKIESVYQRLAE